ncbi:DUF547 domain-containing protein [Aquimarina pacifica]|uniref:DUF547 domain-containing protein n=1 Tax=Aquimarina pacifica TaxID=1296415 RepID=UPI00046F20F5|nr:DUF547 domain-containing protein [Aquimarina pacifica]
MRKLIIIIALLTINLSFGQTTKDFFVKSDVFLKKYVFKGKVDYKAVKHDISLLEEVLDIASKVRVSKAQPKTYKSFYINAYNLAVIKGVVDNYPIKSPLDVKGFFDTTQYNLAGKKTTLNDLENIILRKQFPAEARFHFVLVCAGLGCPPIINEAYKPNSLETQLQRQTVKALNNPYFIKVTQKKVQLSKIFEWYKVDFVKNGSEIDFINKFRKEKLPFDAIVSYYAYDWRLNETKHTSL